MNNIVKAPGLSKPTQESLALSILKNEEIYATDPEFTK